MTNSVFSLGLINTTAERVHVYNQLYLMGPFLQLVPNELSFSLSPLLPWIQEHIGTSILDIVASYVGLGPEIGS